jgi:hypothetical protein
VSQTVPDNWLEIAQVDGTRISDVMKNNGVEVLINLDETFVHFYPSDDYVCAPVGVKRVGSKIHEDEKLGCTVMVGMEFFSSKMLPPFLVLTAKHEGNLAREWESYEGPARVCFQPKHWMDAYTAKKCLDWILTLYPGKKIGVIWDYAGAHIDAGVQKHANSVGIILEFINKGMTSLQQPCDLWANQPLKAFIKKKYYEFRMSLDLSSQRKVKVPRETVVKWVEQATQHLCNSQKHSRDVAKTFAKCGLDPHDEEKLLFAKHLENMSQVHLYNALLQNQQQVMLD